VRGFLGMGDRLAMQPAAARRDARLTVRQVALRLQSDRGGGGEARAVGVVIGELSLPEQTQGLQVVRVVGQQRPQPGDGLGRAPVLTQGGGVLQLACIW
jgi:hypothetical protein